MLRKASSRYSWAVQAESGYNPVCYDRVISICSRCSKSKELQSSATLASSPTCRRARSCCNASRLQPSNPSNPFNAGSEYEFGALLWEVSLNMPSQMILPRCTKSHTLASSKSNVKKLPVYSPDTLNRPHVEWQSCRTDRRMTDR